MPTEDTKAETIWTLPTLKILVDERTTELRSLIGGLSAASEATFGEVRAAIDNQIEFRGKILAEMDRRIGDRLDAESTAGIARVRELGIRCDQRIEAIQTQHAAMIASMDRAVTKAENAAERRFESINEFRAALGDQQARLIPRIEADQRFNEITTALHKLQEWQLTQAGALAEKKGHVQEAQGAMGNATAVAAIVITVVIAMVGAVFTIIQSRVPAADAIRPLVASQPNQLTHEQMLQLLEGKIDERISRIERERTKP